jgi:hypothetical protein
MIQAINNSLLIICLAASLFAFLRGGAAERIGAAIILANLLAYAAKEALFPSQLAALLIDGITALLLLAVALRYASVWLGAVMLLYALQFALHAFYFVMELPRDRLHMIVNNANFFVVNLCLAAGALMAWRRRIRAARASNELS